MLAAGLAGGFAGSATLAGGVCRGLGSDRAAGRTSDVREIISAPAAVAVTPAIALPASASRRDFLARTPTGSSTPSVSSDQAL
ncbi:hypothetical protein MYIN104542_30270 [Mycobacterium intermedium]